VFQSVTGILDVSGVLIIKPSLGSIAAVLLIASDRREIRVIGLLHP
jgi:hypothetical protein